MSLTMKYPTILAALVLLLAGDVAGKGTFTCENTNEAPNIHLGGYNVPGSDYTSDANYFSALWERSVADGKFDIDIQAANDFNPTTLSGLDQSTGFAIDVKSKDGWNEFRGIGIYSGGNDDTEISNDEGIYIHFGGLIVKEVSFGVRAFFFDNNTSVNTIFERGLLHLYKDGQSIADSVYHFTTDGEDGHDGQEFYHMKSDKEFDAVSFVTYSHHMFEPTNPVGNHDYFLEYLDLCYEYEIQTDATPAPTPAPTPIPIVEISGDPHIRTWSGKLYDFHGVCDLVLLQNPDFEKGLGLDIHVRTTQLKQFSYVSSAALRIGNGILEVNGDGHENRCWINGQGHPATDEGIIGFISGYPISHEKVSDKQHKFTVKLGGGQAITMMTFKKIVRVQVEGATAERFGSSLGLLGSYVSGETVARDGKTVIEDANEFGGEWQVRPFEGVLFHNVEGPQAPEKCDIPAASNLRRRLAESNISEEEAKIACARVSSEDFEICVFDVMATGDMDVAGAY